MKRVLISLLLVLSLVLSGCEKFELPDWLKFGSGGEKIKPQVPPEVIEGTVLARVNGKVITLEDFNERIQTYNAEIKASTDIPDSEKSNYLIESKEDKERLLDGMVERKLLVVEGLARGLDQSKDFRQAIEILREQLLFAKVMEIERGKVSISTKEVENFYNINKEAFAIPEERRMSMMVLPSENKAKEVLIALLQGGDFSTLARTHSIDESAADGGDIGFIVRKSPFPQADKKVMFEKFEEVAFTLELNKPSTMFKGPDGSYIIKVTEIKESRQKLLSEVYKDIEQGLLLRKQDEALKTLIANLRKRGNIIVHDELLKE